MHVPGLSINNPVLTVQLGPFHPAPPVAANNGALGVVVGQVELIALGVRGRRGNRAE